MFNKAILFLAVITLGACVNNPTDLSNIFEDKYVGFSINYPKDWNFDSSRYHIKAPLQGDKDSFNETVTLNLENLPMAIKLEEYASSTETTFKLEDPNFKLLKKETTKIDGKPVVIFSYATSIQNKPYENKVALLIKGTTAFTIQCNARKDALGFYKKIFADILNSIKI